MKIAKRISSFIVFGLLISEPLALALALANIFLIKLY